MSDEVLCVRGSAEERAEELEDKVGVEVEEVEGGAARNAVVVARHSRRMLCFNDK